MADTRIVPGTTPAPSPGVHEEEGSGSMVESAKESARSVAGTSAEQTKAVADEAKAKTRDVVAETRQQMRTQAQEQTTRLASGLRGLSDQLREMSSNTQSSGPAVEFAGQAAERAQRMATRLEQGGLDGLMEDARRLGRNRPGLFLLGAMGAGFLVGRVVRAADMRAVGSAAKPETGDGDSPGDTGAERFPGLGASPTPSALSSPGAGSRGAGTDPLAPPAPAPGVTAPVGDLRPEPARAAAWPEPRP